MSRSEADAGLDARARWGPAQRAKNDVLAGLALAAMWLVGRMPLALARPLGALVGLAGWALARGERRRALASLEIAFPGLGAAARRRLGRRCLAGLGRSAAEVCRLTRLGERAGPWVRSFVAFPDEPVLRDALSEGRGVVWVTAHLGNWELLAAGLGARGFDVRPVAKESYDPRFTDLIDRWRRPLGVRTLWRGRPGLGRAVAEAFAAGAVVGVLMDQDSDVRSAFVPFFGRLARTPTGAAEMARTFEAPVVAGFIRRRPGGGHEIRAVRVPLERGGGPEADRAVTATLTAFIEASIRERPEDWVWMHERWRSRPPEEEAAR